MLYIAHRGHIKKHPENSMEAIKSAAHQGFHAVEFDVRSSKDGTLYLMHDALLARTTNMKGKLASKTDEELRKCRLSNHERIPTLHLILDFLSRSKIKRIFLEYKEHGKENAILDLITRHHLEKNIVFTQFNAHSIHSLKRIAPHINCVYERSLLRHKHLKHAKELGCMGVGTRLLTCRKSMVEEAHKLGLKVFIYTIKKESNLASAKRLGADGVFSDY